MADLPARTGKGRPVRVFMGLSETAGYYRGLRRGFAEIGVPCLFVDLSRNPFAYDDQGLAEPWPVRLARWTNQRFLATTGLPTWRRLGWFIVNRLARVPLFLHALRRYTVFLYGFNATFFGHWELPLLRALGKTVVFQYHGSDSRPPYIDGAFVHAPHGSLELCAVASRRRWRELAWIDRYADLVIDTPPQGLMRQRPFVNWLKLGLPSRPAVVPERAALAEAGPGPADRPVRILHSPSFPAAKGTPLIRQAIENLKAKGHAIDFIEVIGLPNREVLAQLAACDFVIDQAYADYGMAGFATEAAWYGRPAVVGGYQAGLWQELLDESERPPSLYVRPEELEAAIERLIVDESLRTALGRQARDFVEQVWAPALIAAKYLRLIAGERPEGWMVDPRTLSDFHGSGLHADHLRDWLQQYLARFGPQALHLADKPALQARLLAFAAKAEPRPGDEAAARVQA